jgi:cell division protein FtsB
MNKSLALKNKLYLFLLFLISLFIFIYLFYFLLDGERGLISFFKIKNMNSEYEINFNKLIMKNDKLTDRINRLKTNSIDLDFLDEKVREKTGFLDNNELVIIFNE